MAETTINNPQLPPNATKFYTHFLYKAIFVSIFLLILPLFPSQAPEFITHKSINTTSWEFLQLIFVGIAVSYGLFSKRNEEDASFKSDNAHNGHNSHNAQSYVARLLQGSSVFDDDSDQTATGSHDKVHTWNSQYYRGEPIVVVAKESEDTTMLEKPLLLPVRSLRTGSSESVTNSVTDSVTNSVTNSVNRSNWTRVSRNLSKLRSEGESSDENIVLRSPIPWRSRSGKMKVDGDVFQTAPIDSPSVGYQSSKAVSVSKQTPPPPPPPPPPPTGNITSTYTGKELRRNVRSVPEEYQNRGRRAAEFAVRSRSDSSAVAGRTRSFRTRKEAELDEIERFIENRGSQSKKFMEEDEDTKEEEKKLVEESEESEKEEDDGGGFVKNGDLVESNNGQDNGPDVDKKADEFIAKFREQIRLQRIASIRKSTAQNGHR